MQPNLETCFQNSNLFMDTMECVAVLVGGISSTVRGHPSEHLLMHGTRHCGKSYTCYRKNYKTWEQWNSRPALIITSLWHPKVHTMGHYVPLAISRKTIIQVSSHTGHHGCMWSKLLNSLPIVHSYTMRQKLGRSLGTADIILLKSVDSDRDTWQSQKHVW